MPFTIEDGKLVWNIPVFLQQFGLEDTPENREIVQQRIADQLHRFAAATDPDR